jgi:hypothetical protein
LAIPMRPIEDIDCGVRKWYLRPTFFVKIGSAILSFGLLIYLFIVAGRCADVFWKTVIGRGHVIMCTLMALSMVLQCVSFLFYFYKIFPFFSLWFYYISIGFCFLYLLFVIVFCAGFASDSKLHKYSSMICDYLANQTTAEPAQWFISKYIVDLSNETAVATVVEDYVAARTVSVKSGISVVSMIWLVFIAILYFIVLFESKPDAVDGTHVQSMRSEIMSP